LNDPSFGAMLSELYKQYDHVVIDSPPVMASMMRESWLPPAMPPFWLAARM